MTHFVLTPAYGRDYSSRAAVRKAWMENQDFEHASALFTGGGRYINRDQVDTGASVELRYGSLRKAVVLKRGYE